MWPFNKKEIEQKMVAPRVVDRHRLKRGYASAKSNNAAFGWATQPAKSDLDIRMGQRALRARSRDQYQNNDHAHKFIGMCKTNIVGNKGITMQARTKFIETGESDTIANAVLEKHFKVWGRSENCDVTGMRSWLDMQNLFISNASIDGEVIVHKVNMGKYAFQIDFIDPELLDIEYARSDMPNGNYIKMGIEFNRVGKPVAYHVTNDNKSKDWYSYQGVGRTRIPANKIIHAFLHEFINQSRGVPWMASTLARMKVLDGYEEAALVASKLGASKMGFYYSESGEEFTGDAAGENGEIIDEVEAGSMTELPANVRFEAFDPTYPHQQFPEFVKAQLRGIASGLGVSYNALANDLESVSFSSMRSGLLEEREVWKSLQEWMINKFCRPIYESWLRQALLNSNIKIGKSSLDPMREEKYQDVVWQGRRWAWVDPLKDIQANVLAVESGLRSRSDIIREQGRDPEEVWAEMASEHELMESIGVSIGESLEVKEEDNKDED